MEYSVSVLHVTSQLLAAARDRLPAKEIPARWRDSSDKVWAYLRTHPGLHSDGHNVFLYRHDMDSTGAMTIDFGVQVTHAFDDEGEIRCVMTPEGEVASTLHVGAYGGIKAAHEAIHAWAKANGRRIGGWSWEVYGDWNEDPHKLETQILYLLA